MRSPHALRAVGHAAQDALAASGGRLEAIAGFDAAPYARASGEVIWIGHGDVAMHPRAAVLRRPVRVSVGDRLDARALTPWHPPALPEWVDAHVLQSGCETLRRGLRHVGASPRGLATLLVGGTPPFPLEQALSRVLAFAQAIDAGDPELLGDAALPLLGLGPGLTPAGDDLVGAALFARRMMATAPDEAIAWGRVATRLVDAAHTRSHPVAAALFRDLAMAATFAPLHRLAAGLAAAIDDDEIIGAARGLVAIGHSSGWEMLAGFMIGVAGTSMLRQSRETR
jgi:hypothetical protein